MTERWLVVQSQPRRELWAAENIERLGFEWYFPKIQISVGRGSLKTLRLEALFPRHLFVRSDNGQWRQLTGCWGVAGVIMFGDQPGLMPAKEIQRLRSLEDRDGNVVLPNEEQLARFKAGDTVRINNGHLSGFNGIYQGAAPKDRVKVLLDLLGRKTTVLLPDGFIEPV